MNNCFCADQTKTKSYNCVICNNIEIHLMSKPEREWECHKIITMICGMPEFVCNRCHKLGWYSTAGYGGKTEHINELTGEHKRVGDFIGE